MALELDSIETERRSKLQTLFFDRIEPEVLRMWSAIDRLDLRAEERVQLQHTLDFAAAQAYSERDLDRYYVTHPVRVARFAAEWLQGRPDHAYETLSLALIHNAIEKEVLVPDEVSQRWGPWVRDAVVLLTLDRDAMCTPEGRQAFYARLAAAPVEVQAIKLFDKLDNLFIICLNPDEATRRDYIGEIERYLLPVAAAMLPERKAYLEELIADSYRLGYYRPDPASLTPSRTAAALPSGRASA
ncbi:MAG TPA: hypothetical protein VGR01_11560 [Burkholderiales bacterium]|jgi:(p)ppGpp synthase/HD superfamily hydrolase|nr:hypothetical protein [Burkholderiales bacterium]